VGLVGTWKPSLAGRPTQDVGRWCGRRYRSHIISCWEVAKLVERGRLSLPQDVVDWLDIALAYPGVQLVQLSPAISVESTRLPQPFHKDPADQIIVATARVNDCSVATADDKILKYSHVRTLAIG